METSLPLFCRPVIHDVNNSLPPVVERGVDHEGMSHAGCGGGGGKDKEEILSLFVGESRGRVREESRSKSRVKGSCAESRGRSKLFASERAVVQQAIGSCLACLA